MKRSLLNDWKCCVLRFLAIGLTVATMVLTTVDNQAYSYMFSVAAILFIGLSIRRVKRLGEKAHPVENELTY